MRSRRVSTGLTLMLAGAMLASACSGKVAPAKGQIMVVLQSDMAVPKDISRAQVLITVQGRVVHDKLYVANVSGELRLPGTIAVVAGEKEAETVVVQVVGIDDDGNALTFNKAITTVPRSRIATLRLPMQWLCTGQVRAFNSDGQNFFASSCAPANGEERACVAGSCTNVTLDEATLPTFSAPEVFGGGEYPNDPSGQCFDVQGCFKPGVDLALDLDPESQTYCQAAVNVPANAEVNFAIKTGPNGAGVCDDEDAKAPCFVVLDQSAAFGWAALESGDGPIVEGPAPAGSPGTGGSGGSAGANDARGGDTGTGTGTAGSASGGGPAAPGAAGGASVGGHASGGSGGAAPGAGGSGTLPQGGNGSSYIESGEWHGHTFTAVGVGSTITPSTITATDFPLCVSGTVAASADSSNYAAVGFNLAQEEGDSEALEVLPSSSEGGVNVQIANALGTPLRLQLTGAGADQDPAQLWCREITPSGELVPWSNFSNECWTGEGDAYVPTAQPITAVEVVVPGATTPTPFNFCIDDLAEAFILPKLKGPAQARSLTPPGVRPLQAGGSDDGGTVVVQFPYAVCERLTDDPTLRLTATAACKAKTEQTPLCGPWSTASAPQVPNPDLVLMTPSDGGGEGGAGGMSGTDAGTGGEVSSSGGEGAAAGSGGGSVINECPAQDPPPTTSPAIASFELDGPFIDLVDARQGFPFSAGYGACVPARLSKADGGADGSARSLHFQGMGSCSMTGGNAVTLVVPLNATGVVDQEQSVPPDTMCPYPATGYTGISFWAKTTSANTLNVSVLTPSTVSQADVVPGGTCVSNCAPRAVNVPLNATWAEYQVMFAPLEVDPNQVLGIQIQPTAKNENMFDIDQIAFIGGGAE